jgi:hypothetical protein
MRLLKEDGLVKIEKTLVWLLAVFLTELTWIACSTFPQFFDLCFKKIHG